MNPTAQHIINEINQWFIKHGLEVPDEARDELEEFIRNKLKETK